MKNTILSNKDAEIIEKIILKFGRIVAVNDLMEVFTQEYSKASAHNRLQRLACAGWFLRIKKGLYVIIENLSSRSISDMSLLIISQALNKDSYISLDAALNYYGMFDQYTKNITAVNLKFSKNYKFQDNNFKFVKVDKKYYFGFTQVRIDGKIINIATREKALLDILYCDNSFYSASLVYEKLKEHKNDIDFDKLREYGLKFGVSIQRKIGLLFDELEINSDLLLANSKRHLGYSRFTKESKKFNAKWRLYYDDRIIK
jgi:predicted transcriptional regulator of viral defense system